MSWVKELRPGYFGRRKAERIAEFDARFGKPNWKLGWVIAADNGCLRGEAIYTYEEACVEFYERSYVAFFLKNPAELDFVCSFGECIDNAASNVLSGLDYTKQETSATHIQDIAVRNAIAKLNRKFEGPKDKLLIIRSHDSNGYKYGPGNVPFAFPQMITQPSMRPRWAHDGTVEDFWQSNKWVLVNK